MTENSANSKIFLKLFTSSGHNGTNPISANPIKWSNTLKLLPTNCLSVFDHVVELTLKGLKLTFHKLL